MRILKKYPRWRQPLSPGWGKIKLPQTATLDERRQAARSYYYETGDPGPARDVGIKLPDQRDYFRAIHATEEAVYLMLKALMRG